MALVGDNLTPETYAKIDVDPVNGYVGRDVTSIRFLPLRKFLVRFLCFADSGTCSYHGGRRGGEGGMTPRLEECMSAQRFPVVQVSNH
jgi:hypothetical protein